MTSPLLAPGELATLASSPALVLVDARSGADARQRFLTRRLAGARHADLDRDLAAKPADPAHGGRHPLPTPEAFARLLARLGVSPDRHVVVYDDQGGANAAARLWWMLRAAGHARVQVLDGGMEAAVAAGVPLASGEPAPHAVTAPAAPSPWALPTADADEVARATRDPSRLVVDVRAAPRYRGETEPIDLVAGHIPGAVNLPFAGNLGPDGRFLPPDALAARYREALGARAPASLIVHCGSGVTACHALLALEHAGLPGARLYVGSWSEWSRAGRPIATGRAPG
jgi:thiosulfate/3-mercaptopyruvate sulfurtransferase